MSTENKICEARDFAVHAHRSTNHLYDGEPYEKHLELVVWYANKYRILIRSQEFDDVIAAAWLHDTIEDCRLTYNDIRDRFDYNVAELVYALTNEKGRTRKDRANLKYYEGIRTVPDASFLKICDRLANVKYSADKGNTMLKAYRKEAEYFKYQLFEKIYEPMFDELEMLLSLNYQPQP
jgi:(p)ppGpp synthase/HD superfamily hydrolase